ncbi:MAG: hypothetical protein PF501_07595 [Salinisphaera sp.]|jgi:hypothetical protein|nr:hypothetical protein [Salinisphaera sp.]
MKFTQRSRYHVESDNRRYTVSKAWVNGAWIYDAWSRHTRPATCLHTGTKASCLSACETHAQQQEASA